MSPFNDPPVIHYADENDETGLCGLTGFICESWPHVTCPHCLELEPCPPTERSGGRDTEQRLL